MREALDAIHEGMSISKASTMYGIPRTTLKLGKVKPGVKAGPPPLLSTAEEDDQVKCLLVSADIGYGRTRSEVLSIVEQLLARKGIERAVSNGWWNKFLGRHPLLRTRTPATLSMSRAKASSRECIDAYFDRLEAVLQETGLAEYPALYWMRQDLLMTPSLEKLFIYAERKMSFPFLVGLNHKSLLLPALV